MAAYEYQAIDGSIVSMRADADVALGPVTASGWAIVPSMMQAHPFTVYPAGHSRTMERAIRANHPVVEFETEEELSINGGNLRVGQVQVPQEGGGHRITVGAWEGEHCCMTTSTGEDRLQSLIAAFDTLRFTDTDRGLAIDSPVVTRPRPPEVVREVVGLGILSIRPAVSAELQRIPRDGGHRTRYGEVFRIRSGSNALLMLGRDSIVRVQPRPEADEGQLADVIDGLDVAWAPRTGRRAPR